MILPLALLLLGICGLWLTVKEVRDFRRRDGDFSDWIVSDATPLNRRLWRINTWVRLIAVAIVSVVCLIGAFQLTLAK